jgi:hypothetical protein
MQPTDEHIVEKLGRFQLLEEGAATAAPSDARIGERFRRLERFQACAAGALEDAVAAIAFAARGGECDDVS